MMTIETITNTTLAYDRIESAERQCKKLNNARFWGGSQFSRHFIPQLRFDRDGSYYAVVCVNREIRQ
jgi:hypothetical protein